MLDAQFLKIITVLYVEDDLEVQDSSGIIFKQIFNKVIIVNNGKEALDTYEKSLMSDNPIDIIISDIMMPTMDGIELLNHIRKINPDIPYIFTTGHTNNEYLLESIKNNVSDYLVKPVNIKELVQKAQNVCKLIYEHKLVLHNQKEATEYLSIINKVAIVSKTDTKGNITFVNDIFCETSGYLEEELLGKPHNIIRHPEMPKSTFENLWSTVKSGKEWTGKVKNMSKNGESYHVNATIFPLYNEIDTKIVGFMAIRFLITDEESQKREFKTQVRGMITKYKCDIKKLEESNKEYEIQIKHSDFGFLES
ncbi:MAG: response regulator, partial [Campylobacterota bacterium]|nr:response regulator [Campylobacterota bacterium]